MKKYFILAAAALAFAACTNDEIVPAEQVQQVVEDGAVRFDAYTNRATTRAGQIGDLDNTALQKAWDPTNATPGDRTYGGFGVFAYYTDNNDYDQLATPNFMYNQLVTYNTSGKYWEYDPVKYWPNEYGDNAVSDDADRVSFFAYAPYVEVNPASGKPTGNNVNAAATTGITQISRNTVSGDPIVKYVGSFKAAEAVDLCWGVNEQNTWTTVNTGAEQAFTKGLPWLDVQRPAQAGTQATGPANSRVKFTFKHALAKMQVNIDAFVDGYDNTNTLDSKTKIWVRSIRFNGFAMKGALNLNNETAYTPYWLNYNGVGDLEADGDLVVYDGRRDGKEGMENATATNEKSLGLNEKFIQKEGLVEDPGTDGAKWATGANGVTAATQALFEGGGIFYVIPVPDESVEVEIVYDVETIDKNLGNTISDGKTKGSSVENRISQKISFGSATNLEAGKAYQVNLHLGMNSVKFDAVVVDWDDMLPGSDIDLPANMPIYTASTTASFKADASIPGYQGTVADYTYTFALNGFTGGEQVNATAGSILTAPEVYSTGALLVAGAGGDNMANASGVAYIKTTAKAYTAVLNKKTTGDVKFLGISGANVQFDVTQLAVKLGMYEPSLLVSNVEYVLRRNLDGTAVSWTTYETSCPSLTGYPGTEKNNYIRVWRNGAELKYNDSATAANEFKFAPATGTITLVTPAVTGDVIKVTIKCGDVAEETISFTVVAAAP